MISNPLSRIASFDRLLRSAQPLLHCMSLSSIISQHHPLAYHRDDDTIAPHAARAYVTTPLTQSRRQRDCIRYAKRPNWYSNQKRLFSEPEFFDTPLLMLHCLYTDFAVSLHEPEKLDELDCFWSCFPSDLQIYGTAQRKERKTVKLIMARAKKAMKEHGSKEWRVIFKGHETKTLYAALNYFNGTKIFNFISVTDMSRKFGQESIVYQRPVPRYPLNKKPMASFMADGPEWAPTTLLEKFRKLNVCYYDKSFEKGIGLKVKTEGDKASKRGFILKKSDSVDKRLHMAEDIKSMSGIKDISAR